MVKRLVLLSLLGLVLVACSSTQTPTPTPAPTSPPMPTNTPTSLPTPTSAPTSTPLTETNYVESVRKMIFRDWMDAQNSKVGDEDVRQEIARRWGIGVDAVEHIVAEGLNKKWLQSAATATPVSPTAMPVSPTATPVPTLSPEEQLAQSLHEPWAAEEWETVIGLINQILAINPGYDDMTEKLYAAHVNYGRQLVSEGKLGEAKWEFTRALYVKPNGAEAMLELAALAGETPRPVTVVLPGETTSTPKVIETTPKPVPPTPTRIPAIPTPVAPTPTPTEIPYNVEIAAWLEPPSPIPRFSRVYLFARFTVDGQPKSGVKAVMSWHYFHEDRDETYDGWSYTNEQGETLCSSKGGLFSQYAEAYVTFTYEGKKYSRTVPFYVQ